MQRRRWHERPWGAGAGAGGRGGGGGGGGRGEFWEVVSTLMRDLTKARNEIALLMKQTKPRHYGGGGDRRPSSQPICTHSRSPPSPERRARPVTSAFHSCSREQDPPPCCMPGHRAQWSFEQPMPLPQRAPNPCNKRPSIVIVPEVGDGEEGDGGFRICFSPRPRAPRVCTLPALLHAGRGEGKCCLGTQYATLLEDVTCQLRERRLGRRPVDAERTSCW